MLGFRFTNIASILAALFFASLSFHQSANAQTAPEQDAGWASDVLGLRHYSGMRCPDIVGKFFRIKALDGDGARLAGCIYSGNGGMTAVLRQHPAGNGPTAAASFLASYSAAGFEQISLSGSASRGISFKTRDWTPTTLYETMWHFAGQKADYSLWMSYELPQHQDSIGPTVSAFTDVLSDQNR